MKTYLIGYVGNSKTSAVKSLAKKLANNTYYYLFLLLVFFMPLYKKVVPFIIALLVLNWLIEGKYKYKFQLIINNRYRFYILLFSSIYLIYLIGLIYSSNFQYAFFDIEVKLSLLIFPLIFSTIDDVFLTKRKIKYLFAGFIAGCLVGTLVSFGNAIYNFYQSGSLHEFYYSRLPFFHHPSYFAMYLNFSIALLIYNLWKNYHDLSKLKIVLFIILILYFQLFIILLSSKAGIISLIILLIVSVIYVFIKKSSFIIGFILMLFLSCIFIFLKVLPYPAQRLETAGKILQKSDTILKDTNEGTGERILIWRSSLEIMKNNIFFGVGTGDVKDALIEKYNDNKIQLAIEKKLNAHNQYLQTFITLGLFGFLVLALILLLPLIYAIKQTDYIYIVFLIIMIFNLLVESMFETQAGVIYYAFFNSFLFYISKTINPK
ncbi:MAG: O-antigen ligase family protein [Bacteroidales bacterium]|nr:O-antigen ligase family protein [Bacteroidales bacterium]